MTDITTKLAEALELIAATDPIEAALDPQRAIRVAREAMTSYEQAQAEPVAWGMRDKTTGLILDVICPDEHESFEGDYTVPLFAAPVAATPAPAGWRFETVSDGDVRVYAPDGETWLLRHGQDGFYGFAHRLATALAATPAPAPLTDERIWSMKEMNGWHAADHYRLVRVVRAVERAHGIGKEASNG